MKNKNDILPSSLPTRKKKPFISCVTAPSFQPNYLSLIHPKMVIIMSLLHSRTAINFISISIFRREEKEKRNFFLFATEKWLANFLFLFLHLLFIYERNFHLYNNWRQIRCICYVVVEKWRQQPHKKRQKQEKKLQ